MSYDDDEGSRCFKRVGIDLDCTLTFSNGDTMAAIVNDISMSGIFIHCAQHKDPGHTCEITLNLDGSGRNPSLCVIANGFIARVSDDGMGVEFTELIGDGSYIYLQQIVLRNCQDTAHATATATTVPTSPSTSSDPFAMYDL
ncbi:MAG: PilZ domain-containing protein [Planctomycetes bacterium]|nr:PilZ domain-containing protein [Planctomycetota bacterium]